MNLFDTHAHLNLEPFTDGVDEFIDRAKAVGVTGIAVIGIDVASSRRAIDLANEHPGFLHAVVGIQPNSIATCRPTDWAEIEDMVSEPGVRGIGETGLDCYWDDTPLADQHDYFDRHMQLCRDTGLPMVIHMRESCDLIIEQMASQESVPPGIMHSFTGTIEQAKVCMDFGLHISFAGMVTFKKSGDLRKVAKMIPDERLLVETDSPYLSPEPHRGKRPNEPSRVAHTLACIAEARGTSPQELAEITTANAKRLFQIR